MITTTQDIDYTYITPGEIPDEPLTINMANYLLENGDISVNEYNKYVVDNTYIPELQIKDV